MAGNNGAQKRKPNYPKAACDDDDDDGGNRKKRLKIAQQKHTQRNEMKSETPCIWQLCAIMAPLLLLLLLLSQQQQQQKLRSVVSSDVDGEQKIMSTSQSQS